MCGYYIKAFKVKLILYLTTNKHETLVNFMGSYDNNDEVVLCVNSLSFFALSVAHY